jgi:hypothetical protein
VADHHDDWRPLRAWFEEWGLSAAEIDTPEPHGPDGSLALWSAVYLPGGDRDVADIWNCRILRRRQATTAYLNAVYAGEIEQRGCLVFPGRPFGELAPLGLTPEELLHCSVGIAEHQMRYRVGASEWIWIRMVWRYAATVPKATTEIEASAPAVSNTSMPVLPQSPPQSRRLQRPGKMARRVQLVRDSEKVDGWPSPRSAKEAVENARGKAKDRCDEVAVKLLTDPPNIYLLWRAAQALRDKSETLIPEILRALRKPTA